MNGRLLFSSDGARFFRRLDAAIEAHDMDGQLLWRADTPGLDTWAAIGDELWTVERGALKVRNDRTGAVVDLPRITLGIGGRLLGSEFVARTAAWASADGEAMLIAPSGDTLAATPIGIACEHAVPVVGNQLLTVHGTDVTMRRSGVISWERALLPADAQVLTIAPLFEGRSFAVVARFATDDNHVVLVVSSRDGSLHHNLSVRGLTAISLAARRGAAAVLVDACKLSLIDLRFGSVLRRRDDDRGIDALAVDPSFQQIVVTHVDDDAVSTIATRDLLRQDPREASAPPEEPLVVETPTAEPAPPAEPPPPPEAPARPIPRGPFLAVTPLAPSIPATPTEAATILDWHVKMIGALVERAIAEAWSSGRLSLPAQTGLPFLDEVRGILGLNAPLAGDRVREADERLRQMMIGLEQAVRPLGNRLPPLAVLRREFGLSSLAAEILMLVASPGLWGELARLFGILANDPNRPMIDELLVAQILGGRGGRDRIGRELDRDLPLVRHGLIHVGEGVGRPFASLRVDPLVVRRLRGEPLDRDVEPPMRLVRASRSLHDIRIPRDRLVPFLERLEAAAPPDKPLRIVVRGRPGYGRRTLLAAIAEASNRKLGVIDVALFGRDSTARAEIIRVALRRAALRGWLPCVEGIDDIAEDDVAARNQLREVFAAHPGPLAVRLPSEAQIPLDPGYMLLDLPALSESDRFAAYQESIQRHRLQVRELDDFAARYRVGPGIVETVVADIASRRDAPADASARLEDGVRQHLQTRLGTIAGRVTRLATWSEVVLPSDVTDSLLELIARIRHRKKVYDQWGYDRTMTTSRGVTALFNGGPGTGKTMVAGVIARELGLDLYRIDLSRVVSKWIGETERNLANVFDAAEDGQAIILFDEADSLFTKRTEVKTSVDRYANLEVNYLLQRLDSFEGIALLTTNFSGSIDPAFRRRLTLRLTFPFPDEDMRAQLWKVHIPLTVPRAGEFDLHALATRYQLSGGYIRNAAIRAAFLAAEEQSPLTQDHLERAIRLEYREMGKLADSGTLE